MIDDSMEVREYNCSTGHVEVLAVIRQHDVEAYITEHIRCEKSADYVIYVVPRQRKGE